MRQMRNFVRQQNSCNAFWELLVALCSFQDRNDRLRTVSSKLFERVNYFHSAEGLPAHQDVPAWQFQGVAKAAQQKRSQFRKLKNQVTPDFCLAETPKPMLRR